MRRAGGAETDVARRPAIRSRVLATALITALAGAVLTAPATATTGEDLMQLWVSPDGDDDAAGTEIAPLATLDGARDRLRDLRAGVGIPSGGATVLLTGGVHRLQDTVRFLAEDSGTALAPITITAAPGADARLSGGITATGPAAQPVTDPAILARLPESSRGDVVQVDLAEIGVSDVGGYRDYGYGRGTNPAPAEIFVDDAPLSVASWPNEGDVEIGSVIDPGSNPSAGENDNRGAVFETDIDLSRWSSADQMMVSGFFWHGWAHDTIRAAAVDAAAGTLELSGATQYSVRSGQPWSTFRVSNLLEEIDTTGEYFIDHDTSLAYLLPPADLSTAKFQVSLLEGPMLSFLDASHIRVVGLTFESSRGSGVYIEGGADLHVAGNLFQNLGEVAVSVGQGARSPDFLGDPTPRSPMSEVVGALQSRLASVSAWDRLGGTGHQIVGNDVVNTGGGGILVGAGDRATLAPSDILVANNHVQRVNRWLTTSAPGIWVSGVGVTVEHNLVHDVTQRALFVNGNEHVVRLNEIYGAVTDADDVGAIGMYRDPSEFGNLFEHNFLHDNGSDYGEYGTQGIFLDDGTSGQVVRGNVFVRAGSNYALKLHGGRHNEIVNNVFVGPETAINVAAWSVEHWKDQLNSAQFQNRLLTQVDIRVPPYSTAYPTLATYLDADGAATDQAPGSNLIANNVAVGVGALTSNGVATFGDNFVTDADPGFADPEQYDYSLAQDSVVYDELPDFEPIPFSDIGLQIDEYRTSNALDIAAFQLRAPAHGAQGVDPANPPQLQWDPAQGAETYRVQVASDSTFTDLVVDTHTDEPWFVLPPDVLAYDAVHHWRVRAESQSFSLPGERWSSDGQRAFRTRDVDAVPRPPEVTWTPSPSGAVELVWDRVPEATSYTVLRAYGEGSEYVEVDTVTSASWADAEPMTLVDRRYAVVASNVLGDSGESTPVEVAAETVELFADGFSDGLDPAWQPDGCASDAWTVDAQDETLQLAADADWCSQLVDVEGAGGVAISTTVTLGSPSGGDPVTGGIVATASAGSARLTARHDELLLESLGADQASVVVPHDMQGPVTLTLVLTPTRLLGVVDGAPPLVLDRHEAWLPTQAGPTGAGGALTFDDVSVAGPRWGTALPAGWHATSYGPHLAQVSVVDDDWQMRAAGSDVWGTTDEFGFVYQEVARPSSGTVTLTATVTSLEQVASTTMAGVMIRAADEADAVNVFTRFVSAGSNQTTFRTVAGGATDYQSQSGLQLPLTLRLVWDGTTVTTSYRVEGGNWVEHSQTQVDLPDEVMLGLATSSRHPDTMTTATFTDVTTEISP